MVNFFQSTTAASKNAFKIGNVYNVGKKMGLYILGFRWETNNGLAANMRG
jgi:hypothetical protein